MRIAKKDPELVAFGRQLAEARGGMGQVEACTQLPFGQSMLSDFEQGVRAPRQDQLSALIIRYGVASDAAAALRAALGTILAAKVRQRQQK